MHCWKVIIELFGGFSICYLIFFANEFNGITASGSNYPNPNEYARKSFTGRNNAIESESTTTTTTTITPIDINRKLMKILASLKLLHSNCMTQQRIIQEIEKDKVERSSLLKYIELSGEFLHQELLDSMPEGAFLSDRLFVMEDKSKLILAKFIWNNFMKECDETEGMD